MSSQIYIISCSSLLNWWWASQFTVRILLCFLPSFSPFLTFLENSVYPSLLLEQWLNNIRYCRWGHARTAICCLLSCAASAPQINSSTKIFPSLTRKKKRKKNFVRFFFFFFFCLSIFLSIIKIWRKSFRRTYKLFFGHRNRANNRIMNAWKQQSSKLKNLTWKSSSS